MSDDEYGVDIRTQLTYPHSEEFEYFTKLEVIDMDAEARKDIESGEGFEVSAPMSSIKKDIKNLLDEIKLLTEKAMSIHLQIVILANVVLLLAESTMELLAQCVKQRSSM